ncbi:OsmC-like protein [Tritrichomonas foetus]|uniref:OsmC-like protein n=1 Tax=Tritrichomonas foetus TaxID=1144522 RepID=A0A1J4JL95_9EUKA|nr:OsmC-like protein [Tritrichomonas foetus]|eukprot:OHS98339.1 OsmC-like protein [Tritrichomonas foetus]
MLEYDNSLFRFFISHFRIMLNYSPLFSRFSTQIPDAKVLVQHVQDSEWLGVGNGKSTPIKASSKYETSPTDCLLASIGSCSASDLRFLLEKKGKKVNNIQAHVIATWADEPKTHIESFNIAFKVDADDVTQEEIDEMVKTVEEKMCPVSQTLKNPPKIKYIH